ncbi:MAG: heme exporter protein A [Flavobacteriales bacterium]|jgi:heme exporter protein A
MHRLSIEQVSFEREDLPLFAQVSSSLQSGDIMQITGHNGCGKTTLLKIIAGILLPSSGSINFSGFSVDSYESKSSMLYLGHQIGIDLSLSPMENLEWYFSLNGRKGDLSCELPNSSELMALLEKVGLKTYFDTPVYQLSAGQRRRVGLARLFYSKAPLWVLDEPFTSIDAAGVCSIEQCILRHAQRGGVVVLTSHQQWAEASVKLLDLEQYKVRVGDWLL